VSGICEANAIDMFYTPLQVDYEQIVLDITMPIKRVQMFVGDMRVERVLQQMFESEIDPDDDGSVLENDAPVYQPRRLTLSML